jgi:hypothetical protein
MFYWVGENSWGLPMLRTIAELHHNKSVSAHVVVVLLLLMICASARAQTLTECGKSDGYAYFFPGGLIPADKSGWQKDGISGRIILNYINDKFDLLIKDAMGSTISASQKGGEIFPRQASSGLIALTVVYKNEGKIITTEHYTFQLDNRGDGVVAWMAIRTASAMANKMSLMSAQCRAPR